MKKLLVSVCLFLIIMVSNAQWREKVPAFKLPEVHYNFDSLTKKFKRKDWRKIVSPSFQAYEKNYVEPISNMPCFYPDVSKVSPIPNYSFNMLGIIPARIPNSQPIPFKKIP